MRVIGSRAVHQDLWVFLFSGPWHLASHSSLTSHPVALHSLSPFDPSASPPVYAVIHYFPLPLPAFSPQQWQAAGQWQQKAVELQGDAGLEWFLFCHYLHQLCHPVWLYRFTHTHTHPKQKLSLMLRGGICIKLIERVSQAISEFLKFKWHWKAFDLYSRGPGFRVRPWP